MFSFPPLSRVFAVYLSVYDLLVSTSIIHKSGLRVAHQIVQLHGGAALAVLRIVEPSAGRVRVRREIVLLVSPGVHEGLLGWAYRAVAVVAVCTGHGPTAI